MAQETGAPVCRVPATQCVRQMEPAQLQFGGRDLLPQCRAGLPITVNDPSAPLQLVYIDDVVDAFVGC